jgi:hypothetical protein
MGTFSTNGMHLFLDGDLVASNSVINPNGGNQAFQYSGYWRLGWDAMANWPDAAAKSYFGGAIAEAQVWNTALDPDQVAALLACAPAGNEPGLVISYPLDEGGGSIVADGAPAEGANDGSVIGAPAWVDAMDFPQCYRQTVTALEPAATYHFRAAATNAAGAGYSADRTFATLAPSLYGEIVGNDLQLSWQYPSTGFVLEFSLAVSPPDWSAVPPIYTTNGSTIQYKLPLSLDALFVRLRRP